MLSQFQRSLSNSKICLKWIEFLGHLVPVFGHGSWVSTQFSHFKQIDDFRKKILLMGTTLRNSKMLHMAVFLKFILMWTKLLIFILIIKKLDSILMQEILQPGSSYKMFLIKCIAPLLELYLFLFMPCSPGNF